MPYDPGNLQPSDPTDAAWALAWVRFLTRDTAVTPERADAELTALLTATAWVHDGSTYYRPHWAAATLVEGDPDRPDAESTLGASVTNRNADGLARSIRRAGAWVDDLIEAATGLRPPTGRTLDVTW